MSVQDVRKQKTENPIASSFIFFFVQNLRLNPTTNTYNSKMFTESTILNILRQIQNNKQIVSSLKRKNSENLDDLYPPENGPNRVVSRWNNDELSLAVKGVRKYGKDFQAIAELLGTKSEAQVRTFFVNYRRKFNLDAILKEFESKQQKEEKESQTKTSTDDTGSTTTNSSIPTATSGAQSNDTKSNANSKPTEDELMEVSNAKWKIDNRTIIDSF